MNPYFQESINKLKPISLLINSIYGNPMNYDHDKIDEIVLALMHLGMHDVSRTWKSFDWDSLNRLHQKGLISDPVNKNKSIVLSQEGEELSEKLFKQYFSKD